ncbi:MAG: cardiolipin synthase, partial [Butyrivibrio sp.]|nr:cardiolipin synthase [Butyrivibrio sp.]
MWNAVKAKDIDDVDFEKYLGRYDHKASDGGFVAPYADNPMDKIHVGEDVYMSIANSARDYAWYITPYLIITDEMISALSLAARRGVDVRIITPGIPDKKLVYSVTRSYYNALAVNGVRIFEYTPGFCHAKMSVSDDTVATCGTINLDYRSLYHHFENGCFVAESHVVDEIKRDFEEMFSASNEVTEYYKSGRGRFLRFGQMLLRLVAPLL